MTATPPGSPGAAGPKLASPENPVTWPVPADAGRIADGLTPEQGPTLRVYNWSECIHKKVMRDFEKKYRNYDIKVQVSTYGNIDKTVTKPCAAARSPTTCCSPPTTTSASWSRGPSCAPSPQPL